MTLSTAGRAIFHRCSVLIDEGFEDSGKLLLLTARELYTNGSTLTNVDFARVAEGFGCNGEQIDTVAQLAPALDRALKADKTTVLNVITTFTPHPMDSYWGLATQGINLVPSA